MYGCVRLVQGWGAEYAVVLTLPRTFSSSSISIKDYRRTLLQTKKAQNQFRLDTKKNRSEREAEEAREAVAAEVAAQEQENLEREVMERRMELQEDMLINLNHKFPDETSAIEFHLTGKEFNK